MRVIVFDTLSFERPFLEEAAARFKQELTFLMVRLDASTAILAKGYEGVSLFANDKGSREVLEILARGGTRFLALRSAGFNHVDLKAAKDLGISVARVPEYSPYAVAEHAVALILTLNRKIHKAYNRVREGNFSLNGLVGFDLHGKTVGVIGTGRIGKAFIRIMRGFGCEVIAYDMKPDENFSNEVGCHYSSFEEVLKKSDIISLHLPLSPSSRHLMNAEAFKLMKKCVILINTSRGAIVDTKALIQRLKSGDLAGAGLDVYEEEENIFFEDHSADVLKDDVLARLMTFPNVVLTSHQGFLTREALKNISETTLNNIDQYSKHIKLSNEVILEDGM
jgi:D-lactate dehydrogenase